MTNLQIGRHLPGGYTIERKLGEGGFGTTYLARDESDRRVVVKAINESLASRPDFEKLQQDFLNEALCLAKCAHPNVVRVEKIVSERSRHYIVLEYLQGEDLGRRVAREGPLPEKDALRYVCQVGAALEVVHDNRLLHRDLKPENIVVRSQTDEAVLIDFGIAREVAVGRSRSQTVCFSEGYSPVEQHELYAMRGFYTDIYALAATLYVLLTGYADRDGELCHQLPSARERSDALAAGEPDPLVPPQTLNPQISDRVHRAILQGMATNAGDRPQSVREWLATLTQPAANLPVSVRATQPSVPALPASRARKNRGSGAYLNSSSNSNAGSGAIANPSFSANPSPRAIPNTNSTPTPVTQGSFNVLWWFFWLLLCAMGGWSYWQFFRPAAPVGLQFRLAKTYRSGQPVVLQNTLACDKNGHQNLDSVLLFLRRNGGSWQDLDTIARFEINSNDTECARFPYQLATLQPGKYELKAIALDKSKLQSEPQVRAFAINSPPLPVVLQADPTYASDRTVRVSGRVCDPDGKENLDEIVFQLRQGDGRENGEWKDLKVLGRDRLQSVSPGNRTCATFRYPLVDLPKGNYRLRAIAFDRTGDRSEPATRDFQIANAAPRDLQFALSGTQGPDGYHVRLLKTKVCDDNGVRDIARVEVSLQKKGDRSRKQNNILVFAVLPGTNERCGNFRYELKVDKPGDYELAAEAIDRDNARSDRVVTQFRADVPSNGRSPESQPEPKPEELTPEELSKKDTPELPKKPAGTLEPQPNAIDLP